MNYKTAIVNFEAFFIPKEDRFNVIMRDIQVAASNGCNSILGLMLADGFLFYDYDYSVLLENIKTESAKFGIEQIVLVPGICHDGNVPGFGIIKDFNYNLHLAYLSYKDNRHLLKPWNPNATKFLFLGGVPDRPNRINLMEKFYKSGLLKDAVWSFFKPWTTEQKVWCRNALSNYSDKEYNDFLDYCENKIDDMYLNSKEYGTSNANFDYNNCEWFKNPSWIDPQVFANTLLSVVSEGNSYKGHSSKFLTEKTWRVFAQRHPYILAANDEMMEYVKSLGFKTFNSSNDLDSIVESVKIFLEQRPDVTNDVEYNYKHFFKLGEENTQVLIDIQNMFNISSEEIDKWFNKTGFSHLIRKPNE